MNVFKLILLLFIAPVFTWQVCFASPQPIQEVTTTTDLADLAGIIGGDKVRVVSLSRGNQMGCHSVEPRPSMVVNLSRADILIKIGLDYDSWVDALVDSSRNAKIVFDAAGYIDASTNIARLEVPTGKVDASMGHIHLYGNPHYWLDPENGRIIAENICAGLVRIVPLYSDYFIANKEAFIRLLAVKIQDWKAKLLPYKSKKIVSYHKSWEYFAKSFGFDIITAIEPKPGIPPSPAYLKELVAKLKKENNLMILHENVYPDTTSRMIARETGAKLLQLPVSVGGVKDTARDYIGLFDHIIGEIAKD
ncbi:MAG: metal ABC transporter substrate-binding protein [bacterium]|nr:metal ABC transporter substrate-binding protein [bacterium]